MDLVSVIEHVPGKVEAVDAHDDTVYVGSTDGYIILYRVEKLATLGPDGKASYEGLLEVKRPVGHGRRPVEQLQAFPEIGKLVVRCDGNITVHNLATLEHTATISSAKGANLFTSDKRGPLYRLCIAVKKKLQLYEYIGDYVMYKELMIPDVALALDWYSPSICVGYKREYSLLNDDSGDVTELFTLEKAQPAVKLLGDEFLLRHEAVGVFIKLDGQPSRGNMTWGTTPLSFDFCFPYVVSLLNRSVTVHNLYDQQLLQTLPFTGGQCLTSDGHRRVFVATSYKVYYLLPVPFEEQIAELLKGKKVPEALDLFERTAGADDPSKPERLNTLHIEAGYVLFQELAFADAFRLFNQSDIDPRQLISVFEGLMPTIHEFTPDNPLDHKGIHDIVNDRLNRRELGKHGSVPQPDPTKSATQHVAEAKRRLTEFLEQRRAPLEQSEVQEAIDTALLKLYVDGSSDRGPLDRLLSGPNHVNTTDSVPFLTKAGAYNALALLYQNKQIFAKSLEIWEKLGQGEFEEPGCDGINETVDFLSTSDDLELVWKFSGWVLKKSPDDGLKIFTSGRRASPLPPSQVLVHLASFSDNLCQAYLEYLVHTEKNVEEKYHTQLALRYLDTVLTLQPVGEDESSPVRAGNEAGLLGQVRAKLLAFLKKSDYYHVPSILARLSKSTLYDECVVLYSKLGRDDESIKILVYRLHDTKAAEEYCSEKWTPVEGQESPPLLLTLLKVYLYPESGGTPLTAEAIDLMQRHAKHMPPPKVLDVLPPSFPIAELYNYLRMVVQHSVHAARDGQVLKNIAKMENLQTRANLVHSQARAVFVTKDRMCPVCNKRILDKVFAAFPNGTVVHFKCFQDKSTDPVTGTNFVTGKVDKSKIQKPHH